MKETNLSSQRLLQYGGTSSMVLVVIDYQKDLLLQGDMYPNGTGRSLVQ